MENPAHCPIGKKKEIRLFTRSILDGKKICASWSRNVKIRKILPQIVNIFYYSSAKWDAYF